MKKFLALAAVLGAIGCTSTGKSTMDNKYAADAPPPIQKNTRPTADGDPMPKLPPSQTRVNPDDIDDSNYKDMSRKLESELKIDGRAMSQAKPPRD
jgi:hypothetical protein